MDNKIVLTWGHKNCLWAIDSHSFIILSWNLGTKCSSIIEFEGDDQNKKTGPIKDIYCPDL